MNINFFLSNSLHTTAWPGINFTNETSVDFPLGGGLWADSGTQKDLKNNIWFWALRHVIFLSVSGFFSQCDSPANLILNHCNWWLGPTKFRTTCFNYKTSGSRLSSPIIKKQNKKNKLPFLLHIQRKGDFKFVCLPT